MSGGSGERPRSRRAGRWQARIGLTPRSSPVPSSGGRCGRSGAACSQTSWSCRSGAAIKRGSSGRTAAFRSRALPVKIFDAAKTSAIWARPLPERRSVPRDQDANPFGGLDEKNQRQTLRSTVAKQATSLVEFACSRRCFCGQMHGERERSKALSNSSRPLLFHPLTEVRPVSAKSSIRRPAISCRESRSFAWTRKDGSFAVRSRVTFSAAQVAGHQAAPAPTGEESKAPGSAYVSRRVARNLLLGQSSLAGAFRSRARLHGCAAPSQGTASARGRSRTSARRVSPTWWARLPRRRRAYSLGLPVVGAVRAAIVAALALLAAITGFCTGCEAQKVSCRPASRPFASCPLPSQSDA